jgi:ABC-2 type transport system permease protein
MRGVKGIATAQIWMLTNTIGTIKHEPRLKVIFISAIVLLFWFGSFALFYEGLSFFWQFPLIGPALVDESIYIFSAILFIMLTLSSIIVCYVTYYTSEEVTFLFSKPIETRAIFFYRFMQSVIFSSWAFLFLGVTFIVAYAIVKGVPFWFYLLLPLWFVSFILLPASIASAFILAAVRLMDYRKVKHVLAAILLMGALFLYWYYKKNIGPDLFSRSEIGYFLDNFLYHLRIFKHPLFPGYWMAKSMVNSGINNLSEGLFYLAAYATTTLFVLQVNWFMAGETFYAGWLSSRGGKSRQYMPPKKGLFRHLTGFPFFFPRPTAALVTKDIKIFVRDFGQWSQFLIYLVILAIYIFNLRNMPQADGNIYWKMIVTFLNLSATSLVLAGFSVRFLYPLISLEGNKFWILGLAPITFRGLVLQKFIVNFLGIFLVSEFLMIATNVTLQTGTSLVYTSCGLAAMVSVGLVGLSIGLGTIYPNFKEDNSAKIVSGFGGTLNFVIALFYVSFIIVLFAVPYFSFEIYGSISRSTFHLIVLVAWILALIVTAIVGILPLIFGYRTLEQRDF